MNLLHIVNAKVWGGGEAYVYNLCQEEQRLGHRNIVVVDTAADIITTKYERVATVIRMPLRGLSRFLSIRMMTSLCKKYQIDVVTAHSGSTMPMLVLLKVCDDSLKTVVFRHNLLPNKTDYYHRWMIRHIDRFICVSNKVYTEQVNSVSLDVQDKFRLVYSGIPLDTFKVIVKKVDPACFSVGYAGRIIENKGIYVLAQAIKQCVEQGIPIMFHYCGHGSDSEMMRFKDYLKSLNLTNKVINWGYLEDLNKFYSQLDVFVLPSIVPEAFGLALIEAMSKSIPVITTDSGAQDEIVTNHINGYIVRSKSVEDLVVALKELYYNIDERIVLGATGQKEVYARFTLNKMVADINDIIAEI